MTLNDFLSRCRGKGPLFICPSHDDSTPSLSVTDGGDKILVHCFGGWSPESVVAAMGLTMSDLFYDSKTEKPFRLSAPPPRQNLKWLGEMWAGWALSTRDTKLGELAVELGVSDYALRLVGCCWAWPYDSWGFPMFDAAGEFRGMRLRRPDGSKWSVPGGREGLFIGPDPYKPYCIVEGPTDLAALVTMGLAGLGRPSCKGAMSETKAYCQKHKLAPIVVSDADGPGLEGARELCAAIPGSKLAMLPAKDTRAFLQAGGTKEDFLACISGAMQT